MAKRLLGGRKMGNLEKKKTEELMNETKSQINTALKFCSKLEDKNMRACILNLCFATQNLYVVLERVIKDLKEINQERGV